MDLTNLVPADFPPKPDMETLYQKLTLQLWNARLADERKRMGTDTIESGADNTPEILSDS